ncbi:MAG: hypothetical protein LH606_16775 [Cytophagaceae bacterium]|nr:hypothetical protein [Cytophagaceae bacterium]
MKPFTQLFILLILLATSAFAQRSTGEIWPWSAGKLQIDSGDWLTGEVRYNPDLHVVEFGLDGAVQVFSAQRVTSFYFFDAELGRNRTFVTRDYDPHRFSAIFSREVPTFFEVLVEGRVQLLAHEQEQRSTLVRTLIGRGSNKYFLAYPDGHIVAYHGRLRQLYAILADRQSEVDFFVKRVDWFKREQKPVVELVRFYNSLGG